MFRIIRKRFTPLVIALKSSLKPPIPSSIPQNTSTLISFCPCFPINSIKNSGDPSGLISNIIPWDYLEAAEDAYFVGKAQHEAFCFCERQGQETNFFKNNDNNGYRASVDMRFGLWFKPGAWKAWVRGGGSAA